MRGEGGGGGVAGEFSWLVGQQQSSNGNGNEWNTLCLCRTQRSMRLRNAQFESHCKCPCCMFAGVVVASCTVAYVRGRHC